MAAAGPLIYCCYAPGTRWRGAVPRAGYWQAAGLQALPDTHAYRANGWARGPQIVDTGQNPTGYDPAGHGPAPSSPSCLTSVIYSFGSSAGSEAAQCHAAVTGALGGVGIVGYGLGTTAPHRPKLSRTHAVGREVETYGLGALPRKLAVCSPTTPLPVANGARACATLTGRPQSPAASS